MSNDAINIQMNLRLFSINENTMLKAKPQALLFGLQLLCQEIGMLPLRFGRIMIQSSIIRDDRIRQTLQIDWLSAGNDVIQFFPDTEHRHRLKTLKVQIFLRHRRHWLRWLQNIKSKQPEVLYTLDTLKVSVKELIFISMVNISACMKMVRWL